LTYEIGCDDDENTEGKGNSEEYEERQIIDQHGHLAEGQRKKFCEKFLFFGSTIQS
jgi:hypothetical protein